MGLGETMVDDEVWGNVKDWGLQNHSDSSPVFSIDPVCGNRVEESKAAGKTRYGSTDYFFCSKECRRNFELAPGDYLGRPHWQSRREVDINTAPVDELRSVFRVDEGVLNHIVQNRPYRSWAEFKSKNSGFSDPMLEGLKQSGVSISPADLNRIVWP